MSITARLARAERRARLLLPATSPPPKLTSIDELVMGSHRLELNELKEVREVTSGLRKAGVSQEDYDRDHGYAVMFARLRENIMRRAAAAGEFALILKLDEMTNERNQSRR